VDKASGKGIKGVWVSILSSDDEERTSVDAEQACETGELKAKLLKISKASAESEERKKG